MEDKKVTVLVDGISAAGVHNGVVRVKFFQLTSDGRSEIVLELQIPQNQIKEIISGLSKFAK